MKRLRVKPEVTLELVPLIDVVFLLLIFFMVTTTFVSETIIDLTLPEAAYGQSIDAESSAVSLSVDKDGRYSVNGVLLDQHDRSAIAESLLLNTRPGDTSQVIILSADSKSEYQSIVTALDALSSVGLYNIAMKTVLPQTNQKKDLEE